MVVIAMRTAERSEKEKKHSSDNVGSEFKMR